MFPFLAHLNATRPRWVLLAWFALSLVSLPLAALAPGRLGANTSAVKGSESQQVMRILNQAFGLESLDRTLVVSASALPPADPRFLQAYGSLTERLKQLDGVRTLTRFDAESPLKLSGKVGGQYVTATIVETRLANADPVIRAIRRETQAVNLPQTRFYVTGASAVTQDFLHRLEADATRSEVTALPLTGLVLVLAFGALVAAGIPLVVGMLSITLTLALVWGLTHLIPVASLARSVVTLLCLGAGIDYALLMVNRFREELARGLSAREAAAVTTRTAGRSVAFSGLTVGIAMSALLVPDLAFARSMGLGGVLAVAVTVLTSITLVPSLLALLGERVNSPRRLQFRLTASGRASAFWGHWGERVMERPWRFTLLGVGFLLGLAWPTLSMRLGYTGAFGLSSQVESRRGLELIRPLELGGSLDAFEILLDLGQGGFEAEARSKWRKLDGELNRWPEVRLVISPFLAARSPSDGGLGDLASLTQRSISQDRRYLRLTVIPKEHIRPEAIRSWETRLREAAHRAGFRKVLLGGAPVGSQEFTDALVGAMPLAIGLVYAATFVLLGVMFRSLVIPLKSIVMNSLTVGAAYGVITLIFLPQGAGVIDSSLPLILFAVIFGLSMDYEIFLLSRVQEGHLKGLETRLAVKAALERTASVITSAALIMVIVFLAFVQGDVVANRTIGLGLAVAVILDASLVRLVLVPAVLVLAGRWNWWLPGWLKNWMPRVSLER
ncbi:MULTISPECIES: MMPL family transporter [unclassified Meiothermus]|uniref:MMPL family transporter n=1 Tax=unclassified Meiothermus TaxID=370471 RepID=UPI000D7C52AB|nr:MULTISPECIES: MMPL family transporter [unclassified Meiothermus]PZA08553.1 MMPL family transporter [Meiothermus sp. Pnk-1]RYM40829.1 MMPL family transporter [Meiothermus sp. PNK-Is4]